MEHEFVNEETAYLLVYVRLEKFAEYQSIPTTIPKDWLLKNKAEEKMVASRLTTVVVLILEESPDYDIFDEEAPTIPIELNDD